MSLLEMTPLSLLIGLIVVALCIFAIYHAVRSQQPLLGVAEDESPEGTQSMVQAKPLTFKSIVWGVFCGMWLFSLSAGLLYLILRLLNSQ